jgi:hypothetical protein
MKYFLIFLAFLSSLMIFGFFVLFTQSGNNALKPYLENYIAKQLQQDAQIEAFTLKTSFIDMEVIVNKNSKFIVNGDFDILKKSFMLDYIVNAEDLKTPYVNIQEALHVKGKIEGNIDKFSLKGSGSVFRSQVSFVTSIVDKNIRGVKLNAKNIKIEDILTFLKKPIYSRGMIDVVADVKSTETNNYAGNSDITIHYGTLNNPLLEKDFGVKLPTMVTYRGTIKSKIYADKVYAITEIFSNVAKIETKKTEFNLTNKVFYSDYLVHIPNLSLLQKDIQGEIELSGNVQKDSDFSLDVNSNTLDGTLKAIVFNDTMKVNLQKMSLAKITTMLKQPNYSDGKLTATLDMQNIKSQEEEGRLTLHVEEGALHVNELTQTEKKETVKYKLSLASDIKKETVTTTADLDADILDLKLRKTNLNLNTNYLEGLYSLHVKDLNNLYMFTNRAMKGELQVDGNYAYVEKKIQLDGASDFLDAKTTFTLDDNVLHVNSDDLSIVKITDMLYYPKVFDSFSTLEADYNLTSEVGVVSINALNGKLMKSELTDLVQAVSGFDLSTEIYKDSLFRGVVNKNKVDFSLLMNGLESYFKIPDGYVDLGTNKIKSDFDIKIKNKDLQGSIKGSLEKPIVELSGSEYIKQKLDKAIDKNVPEEWKDTAKGLLKLFG